MERYEALRAHALGDGRLAFVPLGLAILRHRGVVAWMDAEEAALDPTDSAPEPLRQKAVAETEVVAPDRSELVALLASTALLVAAGGG